MFFPIRRYLANLFVSIVFENKQCFIYGRVLKNRKVIETIEATFDNEEDNQVNSKIISYLNNLNNTYHSIYISLYLDSMGQGAIPTSNLNDFPLYHIDPDNVFFLKFPKNWSAYAPKFKVKALCDSFQLTSGVDLIYSPFVLLYKSIEKIGFEDKFTLYIYNHKDSFTLGVFKNGSLYYGAFYKTKNDSQPPLEEGFVDGNDTLEQDYKVENILNVGSENFDNKVEILQDLDDLIDDKNFDYSFDSSLEDIVHQGNAEENLNLFSRDMQVFNYIKASINEYYTNDNYEKDFLEDLIIFDTYKISQAMINFIESELLLKTRIVPVNTLHLMNELAVEDINL